MDKVAVRLLSQHLTQNQELRLRAGELFLVQALGASHPFRAWSMNLRSSAKVILLHRSR
jgi:hypothetical protein